MAGANQNYGRQGKTFGKIMLGIILFAIMLIYIYHHQDNGIVFPTN